jgi:hypothetical protein
MTELGRSEQMADALPASSGSVPPKPNPRAAEWGDWPCLLIYSRHASVGWQNRRSKKGGPCYLVGRESLVGDLKVIERFPYTDKGWAQAWRFLLRQDRTLAQQLQALLAERLAVQRVKAEIERLDASAFEIVKDVIFLGGHAADLEFDSGERYDLRFRGEDLLITRHAKAEPVLLALFGELRAIDVGGPGTVRQYSVGQQVGLTMVFGDIGEVIGFAATKIETIIRVQAPSYELFFHCSTTLPDALRIKLSRPIAAIRDALAPVPLPTATPQATAAASELIRLASMLDAGLLTREEFECLKAQLLADP